MNSESKQQVASALQRVACQAEGEKKNQSDQGCQAPDFQVARELAQENDNVEIQILALGFLKSFGKLMSSL